MSNTFLRIGHRGAAAYATENTLSSIQTAIACGVDMVEMDVRKTKDGQLVLAHEAYVAGQHQRLALRRHTLEDLRRLCLPGGEFVTTLEEALRFSAGKVKVNIDLKEPGIETAVVALVSDLGLTKQVMISSLSRRSLQLVKRLDRELFTALSYPAPVLAHLFTSRSVRAVASRIGHKPLWPIYALLRFTLPRQLQRQQKIAGVDALMVRAPFISAKLVDVIHNQELKLYAWPADNPGEVARLQQLGVDGIESNRPDVLVVA